MQETDFPFEIIIHDDASTDRTAEIVKEYEARYPKLIKGIYQTENQYSKGKNTSTIALPKARGEFVAYCEGDDYWIDPKKLQKQKCFLDNHPDYGAVFTDANRLDENTEHIFKPYSKLLNKKIPTGYVFENLVNGPNPYVTCTSFFRSYYSSEYKSITRKLRVTLGDKILWLIIAANSKIGYIKDTTSVYRVRINSASHFKTIEGHKKFQKSSYKISLFFSEYYNNKFDKKSFRKIYLKSIIAFCFNKGYYTDLFHYYYKSPVLFFVEFCKFAAKFFIFTVAKKITNSAHIKRNNG